jgi:hypothetical protein
MNDYQVITQGSVSPATGCCGTPKDKIMQIPASIDRLNKTSEHLGALIGELLDRISPILRHEPACVGEEKKGLLSTSVPMAGQIDSITDKLTGLACVIDGAINRIEV